MTFTREDYRDKIRSQLKFELLLPLSEPKRRDKSPDGVCKRAKFNEKLKKWKEMEAKG